MEIKKKKRFIADLNSGNERKKKKKKNTYLDITVRRNHQGTIGTRAARWQGKAHSGSELTASLSFTAGPVSLPCSFRWVLTFG